MRQKFGDDFYLEDRPRKHRYIYITGNKYQKAKLLKNIKYEIQEYPKGDSAKYEIKEKASKQIC